MPVIACPREGGGQARQSDDAAAGGLEPATSCRAAAPQARSSAGAGRSEQPLLSFAEIGPDRDVWEYAALVTSLDVENPHAGSIIPRSRRLRELFDELKNQWGWGGFTTHDLKRCRLLAGRVALIFNWWSLFVRLADPASPARGDHQPSIADAGDPPADPACRADNADHQQHARRAAQGAPRLSTHRPFPGAAASNCGAVGSGATVDRILSEALKTLPEGPPTQPSARLAPA